ncbi:glycosyltransferase family 2 protein [Verrucosispora sp. WMMD573]|uniref:glycosyltransferase family 2 protein n=1 Tax=Verrucosispora sp. WMMD573 TaxID=3015149 RepID=UPI00248C7923|nr:glycosyltransferase family 2 protein [Verrucosispora sp. WMMD573]WBB53342.1 glycosyltransferase family 2 protein [Verrucosispora sp. WMMD573]
MVDGKRLLIIVPALNEAATIGDVVGEIRGELPAADVLVVDDGSTDHTAAVATAAGARVARLPYNLGVGGAMRLGYRYAHDHDYDAAVQVDADGQHDPRYVPKLVDLLDDYDLVIGARFAGEGEYTVRGPRRWAMAVLSLVLSGLAGATLTDTTSGFRAANRRMIAMFAHWYPVEYLGDTVETLVHAARRGYRIQQVPVAMRRRMAGTPSHSPTRALIYLGRALAVLTLALIRR